MKELGVGEAGFPFFKWIQVLFFSSTLCWVQKESAPVGFGCQFTALRLCPMYLLSVLHVSGPPQCLTVPIKTHVSQPGQFPTFSLTLSLGLCLPSQTCHLRDSHTLYLVHTLLLSLSFACTSAPPLVGPRTSLGPSFYLTGLLPAQAPLKHGHLTCAQPVCEARSCKTSSPWPETDN